MRRQIISFSFSFFFLLLLMPFFAFDFQFELNEFFLLFNCISQWLFQLTGWSFFSLVTWLRHFLKVSVFGEFDFKGLFLDRMVFWRVNSLVSASKINEILISILLLFVEKSTPSKFSYFFLVFNINQYQKLTKKNIFSLQIFGQQQNCQAIFRCWKFSNKQISLFKHWKYRV